MAARKDMRSCERKYCQTWLTVHKYIVTYKYRQVKKITRPARTSYYASKILEQSCNDKEFFPTIYVLFHTPNAIQCHPTTQVTHKCWRRLVIILWTNFRHQTEAGHK